MPEKRPDNSVNYGAKKKRDFNAKEMVEDKEPPQKIECIDFSICSGEEIVKNAVMEVSRDDMYTTVPSAPGQPSVREAATGGPLDRRMGTTNKDSKCKTCDEFLTECAGHFGHLRLTLPVFHQGYFKAIIACLACICKTCNRILLTPDEQVNSCEEGTELERASERARERGQRGSARQSERKRVREREWENGHAMNTALECTTNSHAYTTHTNAHTLHFLSLSSAHAASKQASALVVQLEIARPAAAPPIENSSLHASRRTYE